MAETQCGTPLPDTSDEREAEASDWIKYINEVEGGIHGLSNFCHPTHPCAKPYEEKLRKVRPDVIVSQVGLIGIHAIELWAEPMRRVGPNLNRAAYAQALRGLEGFTTGLSAPIDLAPDRSVGLTGFAVYQSPGPGNRNAR